MAEKLSFSDAQLNKWIEQQNIDVLAHKSTGKKKNLADAFLKSKEIADADISTEDREVLENSLLDIRNAMVGITK